MEDGKKKVGRPEQRFKINTDFDNAMGVIMNNKKIDKKDIAIKEEIIYATATHKASMQEVNIDVDCYVLDLKDENDQRIRVLGQRGISRALGFKSNASISFKRAISSKSISKYIDSVLQKKINQVYIVKELRGDSKESVGNKEIRGTEASLLIDICNILLTAEANGDLTHNQIGLAKQARIILGATSKFGIINLIDRLTGFNDTKEQYIQAFKIFVAEEAKDYGKQFIREFYEVCYKLYNKEWDRTKNHPPFFAYLTREFIYKPLAKSNGAILDLLDEKNPVIKYPNGKGGYRKYRLYRFLEEIGISALQNQIGQFIAVGKLSNTMEDFRNNYAKVMGEPYIIPIFKDNQEE